MGIQSYFFSLTASLLPGNGVVERSSRSQWLHYAPAMKVLRIRKCQIVGTRSVRRASGLLETGLSVNCLPDRYWRATYRKPDVFRPVIEIIDRSEQLNEWLCLNAPNRGAASICEYQPLFIAQSDSGVHSHSRAGGNEDRNERDETQKHRDSDKREWVVRADLEQERLQQS
jgi:hypothetical protein